MKYLSPLFIALGMAFSLSFCAGPLYAGHAPASCSIPDTLARATLSFAEPSTIVPEGSGRLDIGVVIEAGGNLSGHATVKAAKVSTAVEGVDYNIANPSLSFSAFSAMRNSSMKSEISPSITEGRLCTDLPMRWSVTLPCG